MSKSELIEKKKNAVARFVDTEDDYSFVIRDKSGRVVWPPRETPEGVELRRQEKETRR